MEEIRELLAITTKLRAKYGRKFTLDGKLVGDIGEVLAAQKYNIELLPESTSIHDAKEKGTGRLVQIKASMKDNFYFPHESKMPDYFLCVHIHEYGNITTRYNGSGKYVFDNLIDNKIKGDSTGYVFSTKKLIELNQSVDETDRIKIR